MADAFLLRLFSSRIYKISNPRNNTIEDNAWTTSNGGVVVEPTEGISRFSNTYTKNKNTSDLYLEQKEKGSSLSIILNGNSYTAVSWVHDHPFIEGGMNDNLNTFSGWVQISNGKRYYNGDLGVFQPYRDRGINLNMYLIGPRDVVQWTHNKENNVVGSTYNLMHGESLIK